MSEKIEVSKTIDIQIDYVKCNECGEDMEFSVESDSYGDIQIIVEKHECQSD